jgi:integrase
MLKENNARRGFLEPVNYAALARECARVGLWMRTMFEIGYSYGWRVSEVMELRVRQVDLLAGAIRLDVGTTKNGEGREVAMTQAVRVLLTECVRGKRPEDYAFTRKDGQPVRNFSKSWANACVAAGVGKLLCPTCEEPVTKKHCASCERDWYRNDLKYSGKDHGGLLFHDLRRTGVRNMVRCGISEKVAQTISGHQTRSVFERYNIVAPSDLRDAARKLETSQANEREAMEKSNAPDFGQSSGIVAPKTVSEQMVPSLAPLPN